MCVLASVGYYVCVCVCVLFWPWPRWLLCELCVIGVIVCVYLNGKPPWPWPRLVIVTMTCVCVCVGLGLGWLLLTTKI